MGHKLKQKSFSEIKSFAKEPSWDEDLNPITISKYCENKNVKIRLCAPMTPIGMHFVCTKPSDMALPFNQRTGKVFPVWCPDFDSDSETFVHDKCECCNETFSQKKYMGKGKIFYYTQGFIETKDKKGRTTWGDMQVLVFDAMAVAAIRNVYETTGNCIDPQNKKEGYSLWVKYDTSSKPTKYYISKDKDISLKEIDGYSKEDLIDFSDYYKPTDPDKIKESLKNCGYYDFLKNEDEDSDNDFEDDDDDTPKKKKKKVEDDEDEDDDEDDEPKKKKKKKVEDDDDEDDEDDTPKKKKKSKDEDDEDDDEDEDDDDDTPKKKKKKVEDDEDDEDDDEDDDDEDEDDEDEDDEDDTPKKKKKKVEDDEDEDDDEDDEPKKKKKKKYDWDD